MDSSEAEMTYIAVKETQLKKNNTHLEIHPSLIFGIMGNQIVFPENNQLPRDLFSCGQSKQAVSLYHTNYQNRIDKMADLKKQLRNCSDIPELYNKKAIKSYFARFIHCMVTSSKNENCHSYEQ